MEAIINKLTEVGRQSSLKYCLSEKEIKGAVELKNLIDGAIVGVSFSNTSRRLGVISRLEAAMLQIEAESARMVSVLQDFKAMTNLRLKFFEEMTSLQKLAIAHWGRPLPGHLEFEEAEGRDFAGIDPVGAVRPKAFIPPRFTKLSKALGKRGGEDVVDGQT